MNTYLKNISMLCYVIYLKITVHKLLNETRHCIYKHTKCFIHLIFLKSNSNCLIITTSNDHCAYLVFG